MESNGHERARTLAHQVTREEEGTTVAYVCRHALQLTDHAVSRAKFRDGGLRVDGRRAFSGEKLHAGQLLQVVVGDSLQHVERSAVVPAEGPLDIVYEDADILVIDKPAGLVMHPGPGHYDDTLANRVRAHLEDRGVDAGFHAVFRLDRDTSGLVVIATNAHAQDVLQRALHTPAFERTYLGVVADAADAPTVPPNGQADGRTVQPLRDTGMVYAPIAQSEDALSTYEVREDGKLARTRYERIRSGVYGTLLRFSLETGRTHQIRVHMAYIGHPLIGDAHYGHPSDLIDRTALHSGHIDLIHPVGGQRLVFDSPLPADMEALL